MELNLASKVALLKRDLANIRYPSLFDDEGAKSGRISAYLPILTYILHRWSRHVAVLASKYNLVGRQGKRYTEGVFRLAREDLRMIQIGINASQFLSEGYAERKLMFVHHLIVACREHHSVESRRQRMLGLNSKKTVAGEVPIQRKEEPKMELNKSKKRPKTRNKSVQTKPSIIAVEEESSSNNNTPETLFPTINSSPLDQPRSIPESLLLSSNSISQRVFENLEQRPFSNPFHDASPLHHFGFAPTSNSPVPFQSFMEEEKEEKEGEQELPTDADQNSILSTLHQSIEQLHQALENSEYQFKTAQNSTLTHMRVLEGRISALERRPTFYLDSLLKENHTPPPVYPTASFNPLFSHHQTPFVDNISGGGEDKDGEYCSTPLTNKSPFCSVSSAEKADYFSNKSDSSYTTSVSALTALQQRLSEAESVLEEARKIIIS